MATAKANEADTELDAFLTCQLCMHLLQEPQRLACFHSFCKDCLDEVPKTKQDGITGSYCPICNSFSHQDKIQENSFISDLISVQKTDPSQQKVICKLCPKNEEATWKCLDCKTELCNSCHVLHPMIPVCKNHKIIRINKEVEKVIDKLVLCSIHCEEPIKFNCQQCEKPICINCKVTDHDGHKTETLDNCLDRLLSDLDGYNDKIKVSVADLVSKIRIVKEKKEDINDIYDKCKTLVKSKGEELKAQINAMTDKLIVELSEKEEQSKEELDIRKKILENKLSENETLMNVLAVTRANARQASLLTELQNRLYERAKGNGMEAPDALQLEITSPKFDVKESMDVKEIFGKLLYQKERICYDSSEKKLKPEKPGHDYRTINNSFPDIFGKPLKQTFTISLPGGGWYQRLAVIDGNFWIPSLHTHQILIYSFAGNLIETIKLTFCSLRALCKTLNECIIVASDEGLYMKKANCSNWEKVQDGRYADVSVKGDCIYALRLNSATLLEFSFENDCLKQKDEYKVAGATHYQNSILVNNCAYVGNFNNGSVIEIRKVSQTKKVDNYTTKFMTSPVLCCTDKDGVLLVADYSNHQLQILNPSAEEPCWEVIKIEGVVNPLDVHIDQKKNVWVLQYNPCRLVMYEQQHLIINTS